MKIVRLYKGNGTGSGATEGGINVSQTVEELIRIVRDGSEDSGIRYDAALTLGELGAKSELVEALKMPVSCEEGSFALSGVIKALEKIGKDALPELRKVLEDKDVKNEEARFYVVSILESIGLPAESLLIEALKDPNHDVREHAIGAFEIIKSKKAIPALEEILKNDKELLLRKFARRALSKINGTLLDT